LKTFINKTFQNFEINDCLKDQTENIIKKLQLKYNRNKPISYSEYLCSYGAKIESILNPNNKFILLFK
jgi:hypothetical protein